MDLWVRYEAAQFNSVVITLVGGDDYATMDVSGHLRDGDDQHFVIRHSQRAAWDEPQTCGPDWLRDALIELAERL
jgi:hypothetical protein